MTTPPSSFALTDAIVFTGESFVENHAVLVKNGHVADLVPMARRPVALPALSCANQILAPAYIDCQVNGGGNVLLNNQPTVQGVLHIAAAHRKTGTTRLLPTCISDTPDIMCTAQHAVREARKQDPSILGLHFEGPHLNPSLSGAHDSSLIRPISKEDMTHYCAEPGELFVITLSPEQVSPDQIHQLVKQGLIVSIGHCAASLEQVQAALDAGATNFTHIMNRMPPIQTRSPGVAVLALNDKKSYAGLIADGLHIHPELVRLIVRSKAEDRLYMVSDAVPPAGAETPLPYTMGGESVRPQPDGRCINDKGVITGAHHTLGECVPIAIRDIRLNPERVLRMASTIPAQFLGLGHSLGKILPGYQADIVALDHMFKAQTVWRDGVKVN
ncbi:MAG: N-acetylglucosamine-6-phosphate deacetylase [Alphaproteobacteria bacterium]|nr:N-acetylglucosamine-6-phosphate deacetylase [Alphaproteobacteria bacterium]